jgi:two-component system response regulator PhoP
MRILLVEDELALQRQVRERLQQEGYVVDASGDGKEGLYFGSEYPLDAAIIDLGLPGLSGIELIKRLRSKGKNFPILILTARGRWQDKVEGLDAGADDYLVKPFQMEELLARVKALLRRSVGAVHNKLRGGPIVLELATQKVWVDQKEIELTTFEYRLLEYLMTRRSKVVSKEELADHLYPHDEDRDSNVIEVLIGRLRRKLDPDGRLQPIETLRGRGYRFALSGSDSEKT